MSINFSIYKIAKEYIYKRFPNASIAEKEKYVRDWDNKIEASKALVRDFAERVASPKGKKILDVGCGNGGISIAFTMAGAQVSGVEIEEELYMISKNYAESLNIKPDFYLYDGLKLPFENNAFDFAVSASVLEHTDDPTAYLTEILRVVKPGGSLYLGFPNKLWPKETHTGLWLLTYMPAFLRPAYIKFKKRNPLEDNNLHFYSYFDLQKMIEVGLGNYKWIIVEEEGKSNNLVKKIIRSVLKMLGLPYKAFLPHILLILKKEKIL